MGFRNWPTIGHRSRAGKVDNYPFDLDASERVTRPKTGLDRFPQPNNWNTFQQLGSMSPLLFMFNDNVWGQMWGAPGYGPIRSALPVNLVEQITIPGLSKQLPTS